MAIITALKIIFVASFTLQPINYDLHLTYFRDLLSVKDTQQCQLAIDLRADPVRGHTQSWKGSSPWADH